MPEVKTPPRITQDDDGNELVTFGPEHSWSDVARWIARNEPDRLEMLRLLDEVPRVELGAPRGRQ